MIKINKKGSFLGLTFVYILGIAMILILLLSAVIPTEESRKQPPKIPIINPNLITLEELQYKYPAYNFNETDMPQITTIYSNPKYQTETGLNRTAVYKEIERVFLFRGVWAKTKGIFTSAGAIVTGTFAYIGFTTPRHVLDPLYIFPIFFAAIIYTIIRRTYIALKMNLNTPGLVSLSAWWQGLYGPLNRKRIVYTFWILFIVYLICSGFGFLKPLLIPLFSDYGIKATQAYQNLANISAISGTFQVKTTTIDSFYLIVIRSIATAVYISFFFLVKEFIRSFLQKTGSARMQIAAEIEEEKQRMKDEQQVAAVKILSNLGKYMAEPTKPD